MMKPKPDFNIYIINDNADDESKTGFPYLHHQRQHRRWNQNQISIFTSLMTTQTMKPKPDFNIYIINDNTDDETKTRFPYLHYSRQHRRWNQNRISIFTLLMTMQTMKAKPDFHIYIIHDNTDDETKTGFQYLHY
jgi:hypothetical protein